MRVRMIVVMRVPMTVRVAFHAALHLLHDLAGDFAEGVGGDGIWVRDDDWLAAVVPHFTSVRNWSSAFITIGPRQITGVSGSVMRPRDIVLMPWFSIGTIFSSVSSICGCPWIPSIICCEGP